MTEAAAAPIAYSYERVSSGEQVAGGGLDRQAGMAAAWCIRHGYRLDTELNLTDAGRSAYKGHHLTRGALGRFLALAQKGRLGPQPVLLIEAVDRLSRQEPLDALQEIVFALIGAGVEIVDLEDDRRYNRESLAGDALILLVLKCRAAHDYSKRLSRRLEAHWEQSREGFRDGSRIHRGGRGGRKPHWLELDEAGERWIFNDRAKDLQLLFDLLEDNGLKVTAEHLNAQGIPSPNGARWTTDAVRRTALNPAAIGTLRLGQRAHLDGKTELHRWRERKTEAERLGKAFTEPEPVVPQLELIENFFPAAIGREQFERIGRLIASRRNSPKAATNRSAGCGHSFLKGMVTCQAGGMMGATLSSPKRAAPRYYLRCRRRLDGRKCSCNGKGWPLIDVHTHVAVRLQRHILQEATLPGEDGAAEQAAVRAKLAAAKEKHREAREAVRNAEEKLDWAIDKSTPETVENVSAALEKRRVTLRSAETELARLTDEQHRVEARSSPAEQLRNGPVLQLLKVISEGEEIERDRQRMHDLLGDAQLEVVLDDSDPDHLRVGMRFGDAADLQWMKWEPGTMRMIADLGGFDAPSDHPEDEDMDALNAYMAEPVPVPMDYPR